MIGQYKTNTREHFFTQHLPTSIVHFRFSKGLHHFMTNNIYIYGDYEGDPISGISAFSSPIYRAVGKER